MRNVTMIERCRSRSVRDRHIAQPEWQSSHAKTRARALQLPTLRSETKNGDVN